jgi:hypothetical protein
VPATNAFHTRRIASQQGAELRSEAGQAERDYRDTMLANWPDFTGKLEAPPPLEHVEKPWGGGYRSRSGEYDWFYSLSRAQQARIQESWFGTEEPWRLP